MADLFTVLTDKGVLDASQIESWQEGVILASYETNHFGPGSPMISQRQDTDASIASFLKFANLAAATTALTDGEEVTSETVVDSEVNLTLAEQGNVVTTTALGHIVTGGRLNPAVAELIGRNMGTTMDTLAIQILEAGTNETIVTQAAESSLTASDIIIPAYIQRMYNKLRRSNIEKLDSGAYIAIAHPDVMYDLKASTATHNWTSVNQYADQLAEGVLKNEVGMYGGFRWVETSNVSINADAGASAVDTYHSMFLGYNALAYAQSLSTPPQASLVTGTDKLNRFVHIGWKGVFKYGIIDTNAVQVLTSASTVGSNA